MIKNISVRFDAHTQEYFCLILFSIKREENIKFLFFYYRWIILMTMRMINIHDCYYFSLNRFCSSIDSVVVFWFYYTISLSLSIIAAFFSCLPCIGFGEKKKPTRKEYERFCYIYHFVESRRKKTRRTLCVLCDKKKFYSIFL